MRLRGPALSIPWRRLLAELGVIIAGVLIALAVDSWWERQQEQNRAEEYLRQLLVDMEETQRRLQGTIVGDTRTLERVDAVLGRAYAGPFPPADSVDLPSGYNYFEPLTGTLTALVESGDLRLIDSDSVRFELLRFAALIESTEAVLRHTETMIWHSTEQLSLGRARHSRAVPGGAASGREGRVQIDVASLLNDPGIISALQMQSVANQIRLFNLGRLEDPTDRIVRRLRTELGRRNR